jgi:glycine cleavage system H protein
MSLTTIRFTEDHEWLRPEDDGTVTVGITGHAAEQLGDIVFVDLPEVGTVVTKDGEIVVIESVKAASDILAPMDGEIVEVNEALAENPALASEDPMSEGWFFILRPADIRALADMMDEAAYQKMIG